MIKTNISNGAGATSAGKVKFDRLTLKKGYTDFSQKVSEMGFKYFRPTRPLNFNKITYSNVPVFSNKAQMLSNKATMLFNKQTPLSNKAQRLSNKAQKVSVYSPGTVRQLAYKVASS